MGERELTVVQPDFLRQANELQKDTKAKLIKALHLLAHDFRHPSLQCKKIQGAVNDVYECRVDQCFRLIYDITGATIRCWYVGDHDAALRFGQRLGPPRLAVEVDDMEIQGSKSPALEKYLVRGMDNSDWKTLSVRQLARV
jgi:mRNA-degrading endonuclease YafQ of YafQ-DinJ toxin-antitoxin module